MRTAVAWTDTPPERDGVRSVCYSLARSPSARRRSRTAALSTPPTVTCALAGARKDAVYGISYARDGKNFASGAADKTVIIWTDKAEGVLRYSHSEAIRLAYSAQLAPPPWGLLPALVVQKAVAKHRVTGKVLSMSWTNDGQFLALGQFDGCVSVRDKSGGEKVKIEAGGPCWSAMEPERAPRAARRLGGGSGRHARVLQPERLARGREQTPGVRPVRRELLRGGRLRGGGRAEPRRREATPSPASTSPSSAKNSVGVVRAAEAGRERRGGGV